MFKWRRILSIRNRALLMVGLPVLSLLSAFSPILTLNASAVSPEEVLNRARAWSILAAVIDKRDQFRQDIPNGEIDSCEIFNSSGTVFVGAHVTGNPNSGEQAWDTVEENSSVLNSALSSVGIQRGCRGLLELTGYTSNGTGLQKPGDFGNQLSNRINGALIPNAFYGRTLADSTPGDAISYAMLYYNLTQVCGWKYRNSFTDNTTPDNKARNDEARINGATGDDRGLHYHTYTYEAGKAGDNTYFKDGGREDDVSVGLRTGFGVSGGNGQILDCGDNNAETFGARLADNHRFADAYYNLIKPGGDATPGTCGDRYPVVGTGAEAARSQANLDACDEGFRNKGNPAYCEKFASNAEQRAACEYGRGTATGGKDQTTPPPGTGTDTAVQDRKTCMVEGVGWIVCPIVTFLAKLTDGAYTIVGSLLEFKASNFNTSSGIYQAWSIMRNFANVVFVIAFLAIVFSQVSGAGLSNYGIKKMLPKLVIIAILVNGSFWVAAVAVDISNIAGAGIYSLLNGAKQQVALSLPAGGMFSGDNPWTNFAGVLLAGTAVAAALFYVTLSVLIPVLVSVLATIITFFLALIAREVLIIIIIVALPLLFASLLFNGTAGFGKAGLTVGGTLLGMYPFVGLIFGGSGLAGVVIMASSDSMPVQLAGASVSALALWFSIPLVTGVNKILGRIGLPGVGVQLKGLRKGAENYSNRRKNIARGRRLQGRSAISDMGDRIKGDGSSRVRRLVGGAVRGVGKPGTMVGGFGANMALKNQLKNSNAEQAANEAAQTATYSKIASQIKNSPTGTSKYAQAIAGPTGNVSRIQASAISAEHKAFNDRVDQQKATMSRTSAQDLHGIIQDTSASEERRAAAMGMLMKNGSDKDIHKALNYIGGFNTDDRTGAVTARTDMANDAHTATLQQQLASDIGSRKPASVSATEMSNLNQGTYSGTFDDKVLDRLTKGKFSGEKLANMSTDELDAVTRVVTSNAASIKARAAANPTDAAAQEAVGHLRALENDINAYRSNTLLKQPSNDVASRMDTIHGLL